MQFVKLKLAFTLALAFTFTEQTTQHIADAAQDSFTFEASFAFPFQFSLVQFMEFLFEFGLKLAAI